MVEDKERMTRAERKNLSDCFDTIYIALLRRSKCSAKDQCTHRWLRVWCIRLGRTDHNQASLARWDSAMEGTASSGFENLPVGSEGVAIQTIFGGRAEKQHDGPIR